VDLYLHSLIVLHDVVLNYLSIGKTSPFIFYLECKKSLQNVIILLTCIHAILAIATSTDTQYMYPSTYITPKIIKLMYCKNPSELWESDSYGSKFYSQRYLEEIKTGECLLP
jgi:hypothetical protein